MKILLVLFALAASAFAENVLVYRDIPIAPERMQSAFAGHTVTFARSPGEFRSRLAAGGYGLAVFLNQARAASESSAAIAELGTFAANGGRVIYSDWSQNSALAAPFGAGFAGDTEGGDVTLDPTLATGIAGGVVKVRTTTWFSSAAILSAPVGSAVAATYPGGQPAVVTGNSGRTVVLGFLSDTPTSSQLFTNLVGQTLAAPLNPVIAANSAAPTSTVAADFSASVDTNQLACTVFFDYGPNTSYGTSVSVSIPAGSPDPVAITAGASSLAPHSLYHWRTRVVGGTNVVTSPDATFTTLNAVPVAGTSSILLGTGNSIEVLLPFTTPDVDGDLVGVTSIGTGTLFSAAAGSTPGSALITAGTTAVGTQAFSFVVSDGIASAIGTVTVSVLDDDAPTLMLNGAALFIVEAGTPYNEPGASAFDSVAGNLTSAIAITGAVNPFLLGDYPVSYSVSDGVNTATAVRTVRVVDTTPPLIVRNGAPVVTLESPAPFIDPGASASDTRAGNLTPAIVVSGAVNSGVPGAYVITYTVSDGIYSASTTRTVNVVDTTPPMIALNGAATITLESPVPFIDPGATASDTRAGNLTPAIVVSGAVNPGVPGSYVITYTVSDGIYSASTTRTVNVVDTTPPMIALNGAATITLESPVPFIDPGATASDTRAGNLTPAIVVTGAVNSGVPGAYVITYTVSDGIYSSSTTRTVNVVDTTPPVIALNGAAAMTVEAGTPFVEPGATASDTRAGNLTSAIVVTGSVNTAVLGLNTLTYTVSDGILSASTSRTVLVSDTTPPAVTATPVASRQYVINSALATLPDFRSGIIAQDASAITVVQSPAPGTQLGAGIHVITYAVTDAVGLVSNGASTYEVLPIVLTAAATTPTAAGFSASLDTKGLAGSFIFDYGTDTNYGSSVLATIPAGSLAPVTVPANATGLAPHTLYHWRSRLVVGSAVLTSPDATFSTFNTAPVAGTSTVTLGTGNSIEVLLPLTNPDVDGDVVSVTSIGSGTLFTTAAGSSAGRVRITAGAAAVGTQAFSFVISDGIASATGTVTVTVVDDDLPTLTLNGAALITVEAGSPYHELGATASDLVGGNLTSAIVISGTVNTTVVGSYPVTYSVSDGPNTATVVRTVSVVDTIRPLITLNGSATMSVEVGSAFLDPGAVASDARAGNLTSSITVSGTVNTGVLGSYVLTYAVSDGILSNSTTRMVTVVDTTPPVITSTPPPRDHYVSGTSKATLPDLRGGLVAVDATAVTVTQSPAAGALLAAGNYTITFTAKDAGGRTSTATTLYRVISFATVSGQYAGIAVRSGSDEGLVNFLLSKTGLASGRVHLNGVNWSFSGTLNSAGYVTLNLTSPSALAMTLQLQPNGTCGFTASSTGGAWTAAIGRSPFTSTSPSPWTGSHRILCIPAATSAASPQGAGYISATVTAEGKITLTGWLADGTSVSGNSALFANYTFPVFMSGQTGGTAIAKLSGMMTFASTPGSDSTGSLTWVKPAGARPVDAYTSFTQSIAASGSFYIRPASGPSITLGTAGNAAFTVSSTMLGTVTAGTIGFSGSTPVWKNPPFTYFSLSATTGEMTGFVKIANVSYSFRGTTHQKQNIIAGYATSPSGSHYVTLVPNP